MRLLHLIHVAQINRALGVRQVKQPGDEVFGVKAGGFELGQRQPTHAGLVPVGAGAQGRHRLGRQLAAEEKLDLVHPLQALLPGVVAPDVVADKEQFANLDAGADLLEAFPHHGFAQVFLVFLPATRQAVEDAALILVLVAQQASVLQDDGFYGISNAHTAWNIGGINKTFAGAKIGGIGEIERGAEMGVGWWGCPPRRNPLNPVQECHFLRETAPAFTKKAYV